jgi:hypothetical protein
MRKGEGKGIGKFWASGKGFMVGRGWGLLEVEWGDWSDKRAIRASAERSKVVEFDASV